MQYNHTDISGSLLEEADYYYRWINSHLISKQTPALGLFPRSKASYVIDNVYCAVTIWALSKVGTVFKYQIKYCGQSINRKIYYHIHTYIHVYADYYNISKFI